MSLTETTSKELQELAKQMLLSGQNVLSYKQFGTLIKSGTSEFEQEKEALMLGEIEVDGFKFVYFAK